MYSSYLLSVLRIRIHFNPDPDQGNFVNPDQGLDHDPGKNKKYFQVMTKVFGRAGTGPSSHLIEFAEFNDYC